MRFLFIILIFIASKAYCNEWTVIYNDTLTERIELTAGQVDSLKLFDLAEAQGEDTIVIKHRRLKAIIVTLLTGPLGGHRIYLGTKPHVPVLYSLTLGGGIFVTVLDLFHLIFVSDISRFENNDKFFMWVED